MEGEVINAAIIATQVEVSKMVLREGLRVSSRYHHLYQLCKLPSLCATISLDVVMAELREIPLK